jgi:hypothetical protein
MKKFRQYRSQQGKSDKNIYTSENLMIVSFAGILLCLMILAVS